jgi:hypothetical protein
MDYGALVHRVRELVWEHVPAGSNVAVVSKGDPALILFDQRHGVHYPQTATGQYLGHHPETGVAAVAHLESLRLRGAQYLVIPSIYSWFLDYYSDLRNHLNRQGEVVHRDDVCTIYSLTKRDLASAPTHTAQERQLRDLVAAVLPVGCTIVAMGWSHRALQSSSEFKVLDAPIADGRAAAGVAGLETKIQGSGAHFLVVPVPESTQRRMPDPLADRFRATWTTVLDHRHVCAVFAIPAARPAKR